VKPILRIMLAVLGLILLTTLPWIWQWKPILLLPCALILIAWCVWLVLMYLNWARQLRK
jgi:hypothetical protein